MINQQTAEETYKITFLKRDLDRIYEESGIVADKSDSTIRTALAKHLMDSGLNGVNVQKHTNQRLSELRRRVKEYFENEKNEYIVNGKKVPLALKNDEEVILDLIDELNEHNQ